MLKDVRMMQVLNNGSRMQHRIALGRAVPPARVRWRSPDSLSHWRTLACRSLTHQRASWRWQAALWWCSWCHLMRSGSIIKTYRGRIQETPTCLLVFLVLCALHHTCLATCPQGCDCKWRSGKETVECRNSGFIDVPLDIDPGTQVLEMGQNNLQVLPKDTFLNAGLTNLQRIYLQHCNIKQIDQEAFRRLSNLVELDISHNQMAYVPSAAFGEVPGLRRLSMNNNPLYKLGDNIFSNLPSLTTLELSHCQIEQVAHNAFKGLGGLSLLKMDGNRLQMLSVESVMPLRSLHGIHLHSNRWRCDCNLRPFRQWMVSFNIPVSIPATCHSPGRLLNVTWDKIPLEDYACEADATVLETSIEVLEDDNVTMSCSVTGNPEPTVRWIWHGRAIANLSVAASGRQIYIIHEEGSTEKVSNLTITWVDGSDTGTYSCVAENRANKVMENVSLIVTTRIVEVPGLTLAQISGIIVGGVLFVIVVIIMIAVVVVKFRRRRHKTRQRIDINHKHMNSLNHKEAMLTLDEVSLKYLGPNPVQKPPRMGHYQGIPTSDIDHFDQQYLENSIGPVWVVKEPVHFVDDSKLTTVVEEDEDKTQEAWGEDVEVQTSDPEYAEGPLTPQLYSRKCSTKVENDSQRIRELENNRRNNEEKLKQHLCHTPEKTGASEKYYSIPPSFEDKEKGQLEYDERENAWKDEDGNGSSTDCGSKLESDARCTPSPTVGSSRSKSYPPLDSKAAVQWNKVGLPLISPPRGDRQFSRPSKAPVLPPEEGEDGTEV